MPKIDELKAWAGEHSADCRNHREYDKRYSHKGKKCYCDVPLKEALVTELEAWHEYAAILVLFNRGDVSKAELGAAFDKVFKARKAVEDA